MTTKLEIEAICERIEAALVAKRPMQWYVDRRIATPDGTYPLSEARFDNIFEYIDYLEDR